MAPLTDSKLIRLIEDEVKNGMCVSTKKSHYTVKMWGMRRGERALIYKIHSTKDPNKRPSEKGVTESEFGKAYRHMQESLSLKKFKKTMPACAGEGTCNFYFIAHLFIHLKIARKESERSLCVRA